MTELAGVPRGTRIMAVANQKGGVGKTTTTVNLGVALARLGQRVLCIDLDPQGNASTGFGVPHQSGTVSVYDVLIAGRPVDQVAVPSPEIAGLDVLPATIDLAGAEIELVSVVARESRLKRALAPVASHYDVILIDCPPSLGLLTVNAMVAADEVLIPIQCEYYALEGLGQLLSNIELVRAHLNPTLHVGRILLTMYDARTRLADDVITQVRGHFGGLVLPTVIPRNVRVSEAPGFGQSVLTYDPASRGAIAYSRAAAELLGAAAELPAMELSPVGVEPVPTQAPRAAPTPPPAPTTAPPGQVASPPPSVSPLSVPPLPAAAPPAPAAVGEADGGSPRHTALGWPSHDTAPLPSDATGLAESAPLGWHPVAGRAPGDVG